MTMKVIVSVEDPFFGASIVNFVKAHDWDADTEFHVLNVIEPYITDTSNPALAQAPLSRLFAISENQVLEVASKLLTGVAEGIANKFGNNTIVTKVIKGHIVEEILAYAKSIDAQLIIAGSHGRSGFRKIFLGSVSSMLVAEAKCSVLLIKPDASILETWERVVKSTEDVEILKQLNWEMEQRGSTRVMLALDETPLADDIVDFALKHRWSSNTHFKLLSVVRNPSQSLFPSSPALEEWYEDARKVRQNSLRRLALRLRDQYHSPHIEEDLVSGDPKQAIVEAARLWGADLVILGSRYHRSFHRLVLGSVSLSVLCSAPCSVLVLKENATHFSASLEEQDRETASAQY